MAITYYMLQIPPWLFFILLVAFGFVFALSLSLVFRKFVRIKILRSHNEVTGFLFLAVASFYALFLSFIVLVIWEQRNETQENVSKEGSSALGVYRDIKYYPDTVARQPLMNAYLDFIFKVVDDEFPKMEKMISSRETSESLNSVFYELERINPKDAFQVQLVAEMFNHLNDLSTYRSLRINAMESEIAPGLWLPVMLGAIITLICCSMLDIEHKRVHVFLSGLLGAIIAMFLFTIILLDHPYSGSTKIAPKSYLQIFTLEEWSNEVPQKIMPPLDTAF